MKKLSVIFLVVGFMLATAFDLYAQGYIVPNGVVYIGPTGFGYGIDVIQNPTNGDYTGFSLDPIGKTPPTFFTNTYQFNPIVDEGVRTFLVSANDSISLQAILANGYTELTYPNSYVFSAGVPFFLGFYTGYNPWGPGGYTGIYSNPVFGWAQLVNNRGVIQLLDSAVVIGGGGIYAGTQTIIPIPEPSTLVLLTAAAISLGGCRWKMFL